MATAKKVVETKDLEVTKFINETVDLIKENCQAAFDDVKSARETGSKNGQDLAAKFQFNDSADKVVADAAGYMGELMGAGFSMLICPVKMMERNLKKVTK